MPFPPSRGPTVDDATFIEISVFLDALRVCINEGALDSVYGAFTQAKWQREVNGDATLVDLTLRRLDETEPATPPIPISLIDVVEAWQLDDGAVVAVTRWYPDEEWSTFILVRTAQGWKIDDQWTGQGESLVVLATPEPTYVVPTPPDPSF